MTTGEPASDVLTLDEGVRLYLEGQRSKVNAAERAALSRFLSWAGPQRSLRDLSAHEMTLYQETQGTNVADLEGRLLPVKAFLAYAKKREWTETNLGVHMRVKRTAAGRRAASGRPAPDGVQMTGAGLEATRARLEALKAERPRVHQTIAEARADKDFRENAPLDAARDAQALLESQIRDLEHQVAHAVVMDEASRRGRPGTVHMGSTVVVRNLVSDQTVRYTLVGQNEVEAAAGRISVASPVGQALVAQRVGDEVLVVVPSGTIRFRIEAVEG